MRKGRDVPVFDVKHGLFVDYSPHQIKDKPDAVRLACTLYRVTESGSTVLTDVRTLCKKGVDYEKYIQENAQTIFCKKLSRTPGCQEVFRELFGGSNPFSIYVNSNFDNIAQLHGWQMSTIINYRNTLLQLARFMPNKPIPFLQGKDFDIVIQKAEDKFKAEQVEKQEKDTGYSDSRLGQFVGVLFAVMEYAAANYDIENPMETSERYQEQRSSGKGVKTKPLESLIEKHLRMKGLETESQIDVAEEIGRLIWDGKDPLAIGVGIQMLTGLRPSEVCGLRYGAIFNFMKEGWTHRSYLLVHTKVEYQTGAPSYMLKTVHAYRPVPIQIILQKWLDRHIRWAKGKEFSWDEIDWKNRFVVSKDWKGEKPVKTRDFCKRSAQILQAGAGNNKDFMGIQIPVDIDENGNQIAMEENQSAYQYRRNFGSLMLSTLGIKYRSVQVVFGHKPTEKELRKWLFNHEDELLSLMQEMDKLVLYPIRNAEDAERLWGQKDYREEPVMLGKSFGEFKNVPALNLWAEPYSEEDQVTVRLLIKPNEPADKLEYRVSSDRPVQVSMDEYYSSSVGGRLNLENDYLDLVFAKDGRPDDGSDVLDEENMEDVEEEEIDGEQTEISDIYILDEENEMEDEFGEILDELDEDEEM